MRFSMSRRRFILLSGLTVFGMGGYGLYRSVYAVRNAAARMNSQ